MTAKPPTIFILAIKIASDDIITNKGLSEDTWIKAPMIIMLLTALVTDINGVCNDAVTFQTTIYPIKHDRTNTVKCAINEAGADEPTPMSKSSDIRKGMTGNTCLVVPFFSGITFLGSLLVIVFGFSF